MANEKRLTLSTDETCGDCIHAKVCKEVNGSWFSPKNIAFCRLFKNKADFVEVVHGWYEMGIDEGDYEYGTCSVCGYNEYNAFGCCLPHNYCPNCGAKMDGDGNDI